MKITTNLCGLLLRTPKQIIRTAALALVITVGGSAAFAQEQADRDNPDVTIDSLVSRLPQPTLRQDGLPQAAGQQANEIPSDVAGGFENNIQEPLPAESNSLPDLLQEIDEIQPPAVAVRINEDQELTDPPLVDPALIDPALIDPALEGPPIDGAPVAQARDGQPIPLGAERLQLRQPLAGERAAAISQPLANRSRTRSGLGFTGRAIARRGVQVLQIQPGSPADGIGLRKGDMVRVINGQQIDGLRDYQSAIAEAADLYDGRIVMTVRLAAYEQGYDVPEFATVECFMIGYKPRRQEYRSYRQGRTYRKSRCH